ncbi:hypothetical protein E4U43_003136 [Claviceps pusilla]|uniref:Palmitoyltransferase n=1 Tax=Claviceps pusilla TaxID=123648 RepID=A0A9P7T392_9HYPO|nr:hypothetical protein E4U43_003136 [Claviceps pusilla]
MAHSRSSNRAAMRWTMRIIPVLIVCILGVATYAVAVRLCVQYVYQSLQEKAIAIVVLVLYCVVFILTIASYLRVFLVIQRDPGLVPLLQDVGPKFTPAEKRRKSRSRRNPDPENPPWVPPDADPNSPGLEAFYSRDVFACEIDGRPKWCSECRQWKPDRAHHSSELGRCVRKMDHMCPWVGGMVSETLALGVSIYCLREQLNGQDISVDGWVIAVISLSAFFLLFAFGMTLTAGRYILTNTTNIDMLRKRQFVTLAVRIPQDTPPSSNYRTITYPLQYNIRALPSTADSRPPNRSTGPTVARDTLAARKFAILTAEAGENPWDLGLCENWKSVMGMSVIEWLLPLRHSPCCNHDSMVSDYPFGPLVNELRQRYGVPDLDGRASAEAAT